MLRIGIVPRAGFDLPVLTGFIEALRRNGRCTWRIIAPEMAPLRAENGIAILPDSTAADVDCLAVLGGAGPLPDPLCALIHAAAARPLIGLCAGVFDLAEAGFLDGYECSVPPAQHRDFATRFPRALPRAEPCIMDRDRLTCAESSGIPGLVTRLLPGEAPALFGARDPLVRAALLRMQQSLETAKTIDDLVREMRVGRRKLERHFRADIGQSPQFAYLALRLEKAMLLLRMTEDPISEIALACGFCDASHLVRLMKSRQNTTPAQFRRATPRTP
ncbi:GlxA family transcriptional regulator [Paenirhodobacter sp.]|uniref:GlxA family transcriptional regulator n=1 Tax=Paenirhodobacter sp. TaxID=1965326 RepID=UPI003B403FB9